MLHPYFLFFQMENLDAPECTHNLCYCSQNVTRYLAPWHSLQKIQEYHYDITDSEAVATLANAGHGAYLLTNYNPYNPNGHFTTYTKSLEHGQVSIYKEPHYTLIPPRPQSWAVRNRLQIYFHGKLIGESHYCSHDCSPNSIKKPVARTFVPTLQILCRSAICSTFTFEQLQFARTTALLPNTLVDYVQQCSTTVPPPRNSVPSSDDFRYHRTRTLNKLIKFPDNIILVDVRVSQFVPATCASDYS